MSTSSEDIPACVSSSCVKSVESSNENEQSPNQHIDIFNEPSIVGKLQQTIKNTSFKRERLNVTMCNVKHDAEEMAKSDVQTQNNAGTTLVDVQDVGTTNQHCFNEHVNDASLSVPVNSGISLVTGNNRNTVKIETSTVLNKFDHIPSEQAKELTSYNGKNCKDVRNHTLKFSASSISEEKEHDEQLGSEDITLVKKGDTEQCVQKGLKDCGSVVTSVKSSPSCTQAKDEQKVGNTYCCSECPWAFSTRLAQQMHLAKAHKKTPKKLSIKELTQKPKERLKRSNVVYSRTKPFQCGTCMSSFYERSEYMAHTLIHKREKRLRCNICGLVFPKRKDLNIHRLIHNKKGATCEICGKTFSQAGNMKIHLRIHTKEKPYTCEHCGKSYAQSGDLKTHIRVHTDEKPYLCEVCGNLFHSLSHLARHSKVHTKEKPYTCKVCGKSFAHTHHLKKHYRIHTQEKPYSCEICGKAFSRADYLKQHIRVHTKEKPYICQICGKGFSQGGSLKLHQRVHTRQSITQILQPDFDT